MPKATRRARKLLAEALRLEPGHLEALQLQATIDLGAGDAASAARILGQAAGQHPKDYHVRYKLSQAYQRLGKESLAREEAQASQALRELLERFAKLHEQAIADPANVELRYQLGVVANQLDKRELARSWFTAVLALDPDHAGARQALEAMARPPSSSERTAKPR